MTPPISQLRLVLLLVGITLSGEAGPWAQTFTPVQSGTVNGAVPYTGVIGTVGVSTSMHVMGQVVTTSLTPGSLYDAVMWWLRWAPLPDGWILGGSGMMAWCEPNMGDLGWIYLGVPLPYGPFIQMKWGRSCAGYFNPIYDTAFHVAGQPNGPVFQPDLPAEAPPPCVNACSGIPGAP